MSLKLGEINCDAPIETELEHYIPAEPDRAAAAALMTRLEFSPL